MDFLLVCLHLSRGTFGNEVPMPHERRQMQFAAVPTATRTFTLPRYQGGNYGLFSHVSQQHFPHLSQVFRRAWLLFRIVSDITEMRADVELELTWPGPVVKKCIWRLRACGFLTCMFTLVQRNVWQ